MPPLLGILSIVLKIAEQHSFLAFQRFNSWLLIAYCLTEVIQENWKSNDQVDRQNSDCLP